MAVAGEGVDQVLSAAAWLEASDVHFDPDGARVRVRVRIHGRVVEAERLGALPETLPRSAVQRLKVLARLSTAENRRPQDGQMRLETERGLCDVRVSTWPTVRGERAVARLIPERGRRDSLEAVGFSGGQLAAVRQALSGAGGLILVSGRAGAGKSTTLHALARERRRHGDTILTIEDPVERWVEDYQQFEVDERIGLTFAQGLRSALRQDPDTLVVGEVRDAVSARIAVRAGLLGHFVFATVHAGTPRQAVMRLAELSGEAGLVAEIGNLAIGQSLRAIACAACGGSGCDNCLGLGTVGREAEFTLLGPEEVAAAADIKFPFVAAGRDPDGGGLSFARRLGTQAARPGVFSRRRQ